MKQVISTPKAPAAIGPYSQAIQVGNLVYTSGQIPIDPATGQFAEGGIKEQTRQSLLNVKAILEQAGLTMADVIKTTVFMADMNDFADMNAVYAEFFAEPYPARSRHPDDHPDSPGSGQSQDSRRKYKGKRSER